jgi:hypothetical protein
MTGLVFVGVCRSLFDGSLHPEILGRALEYLVVLRHFMLDVNCSFIIPRYTTESKYFWFAGL